MHRKELTNNPFMLFTHDIVCINLLLPQIKQINSPVYKQTILYTNKQANGPVYTKLIINS